jgi:monoamine oxidase
MPHPPAAPPDSPEILVLGAGIAGLTAARRLAEAGRRVLLLEARNRIGGRLLTRHDPHAALPVELGAEFVHGRPPELLALIDEARLHTFELDGQELCFENGRLGPCSQHEAFAILAQMEHYRGPDLSFADYIRAQNPGPHARRRAESYVEGFNAADADDISLHALIRQQQAEDAIEGDRLFRIREGYAALAEYQRDRMLQAGAALLLDTPVTRLRWRPGAVEALTANGQSFRAQRAVLAVPLAILQTRALLLDPQPESHFAAAAQLAMGPVRRISLVFAEPIWATSPDRSQLSFLFADDGLPAVWWTPHPDPSPILTAWVGGRQARQIGASEQFLDRTLDRLAAILHLPPGHVRRQLAAAHAHDWQSDPFTRGAYSYARVHGADASQKLSEPIADTLFFAGEHTDVTGHWGTVHGALRSALRAANQILAA